MSNTELLEPLLGYLWQVGATDLHISAGDTPRIRVDGKLRAIPEAPAVGAEFVDQAIQGLLSDLDYQSFRNQRQHDFAFSWGTTARFRANAFYQLDQPALALRLIPHQIPTADQLGLPAITRELIHRPHGLVLVTGPTGSGKSTSLAAMIGEINATKPVHILTIEDPVEYIHPSRMALVNQREVGADTVSFADALRAALREDPDVILVGEMRDPETIGLTLTLAETGHLVFATLHTNDASQTVDRVIDVFPAEQQDQIGTQFSMSLAAVISQRLVPRATGGRVAAYEILLGTSAVANLIRENKVRQLRNIIATGQREGMMVLEQSLAQLVNQQIITYEAALEASVHPEDITAHATGGAGGQARYL